jgi:hypothetical protein
MGPGSVAEAQLYRPHVDSLPVARAGDVVLLLRFQVKALSGKGFGLRSGAESAWAVWDHLNGDFEDGAGSGGNGDGEDGEGKGEGKGGGWEAPQIRGPPVEDWQAYVPYVRRLREWYALVIADEAARGRLERAERKMEEATAGGGGGGK